MAATGRCFRGARRRLLQAVIVSEPGGRMDGVACSEESAEKKGRANLLVRGSWGDERWRLGMRVKLEWQGYLTARGDAGSFRVAGVCLKSICWRLQCSQDLSL